MIDTVGIDAAVAAMQTFDGRKVDVYAGFNLTCGSDWKIATVLGHVAGKMGIVVTVASSDTLATGGKRAYKCPANMAHGMTMSEGRLNWLRILFGAWIGGIRIDEMWSLTATLNGHLGDASWYAHIAGEVPSTPFFQPAEVEPLLRFARDHGMFAEWSEPATLAQGLTDPDQPAREALLRTWQDSYPHTIIPTWANNLAGEAARHQYWNWLRPLFTNNTLGWGLNNQPVWNASVADPVGWAVEALSSGGLLLDNDPAWGLFRFPVGSYDDAAPDYTKDPAWASRGQPLPAFFALRDALMKVLPIVA